jgi:hypothetical protein
VRAHVLFGGGGGAAADGRGRRDATAQSHQRDDARPCGQHRQHAHHRRARQCLQVCTYLAAGRYRRQSETGQLRCERVARGALAAPSRARVCTPREGPRMLSAAACGTAERKRCADVVGGGKKTLTAVPPAAASERGGDDGAEATTTPCGFSTAHGRSTGVARRQWQRRQV